MAKKCGIYVIVCDNGDEIYVGQSSHITLRWASHVSNLRNKKHHNPTLSQYVQDYGLKSLTHTIIELCDVTLLNEREQFWMDTLGAKANLTPSGPPVRGRVFTEKHRKALSESLKAARARSNHWKGKKHSLETRLKMSQSATGKKFTPEHCENMAAAQKEAQRDRVRCNGRFT